MGVSIEKTQRDQPIPDVHVEGLIFQTGAWGPWSCVLARRTTKRKERKTRVQRYKTKQYRQTTLHHPLSTLDKHEYYGDNPNTKRKQVLRFITGNVQCFKHKLPFATNRDTDKNTLTFQAFQDYKADGGGIIETGLDWRLIATEDGFIKGRNRANSNLLKPLSLTPPLHHP